MTYSCTDFTDSILVALGITNVPTEAMDDPAAQADLALAEIERLQRQASILKIVQNDARVAFQAADDAWGEELSRIFGKRAGEIRYTDRGKGQDGSKLRQLYDAREAARVAHDRSFGRADDGSELEGVR